MQEIATTTTVQQKQIFLSVTHDGHLIAKGNILTQFIRLELICQ